MFVEKKQALVAFLGWVGGRSGCVCVCVFSEFCGYDNDQKGGSG